MGDGTGPITLVGGLLFALLAAPFQLVGALVRMVRAHAQRRRYLSPHELNLRRASHPLGVAAVLFTAHWFYGARIRDGLVALPVDRWMLVALCGVAFVFGAASFVSGAGRCAGLRDGMLATRAFFKLAAGAGVAFYLWRTVPLHAISETPPGLFAAAVLLGAVWCIASASVRLLLLTVPMQGAFDLVWRRIKRDEFRWEDD
jgi:hypothetical protein